MGAEFDVDAAAAVEGSLPVDGECSMGAEFDVDAAAAVEGSLPVDGECSMGAEFDVDAAPACEDWMVAGPLAGCRVGLPQPEARMVRTSIGPTTSPRAPAGA